MCPYCFSIAMNALTGKMRRECSGYSVYACGIDFPQGFNCNKNSV